VDSGLPDDLQQDFKDTGTSHIIAISGFNIAIIAAIFLSLFGRAFGPRRGAVVAGIGIVFYTLLVGADAAVVRAAVMGVTALFARHFGRRQDGLVTLFAAGAGMCLYNPYYTQDVGFQLSFFATLGLILYGEPLSDCFQNSTSAPRPSKACRPSSPIFSSSPSPRRSPPSRSWPIISTASRSSRSSPTRSSSPSNPR